MNDEKNNYLCIYLMELIRKNNADVEETTPNIEDNGAMPADAKTEWCDQLWEKVIASQRFPT